MKRNSNFDDQKLLGHMSKFWNTFVIVEINYPLDHLLKTPPVPQLPRRAVLPTSLVSHLTAKDGVRRATWSAICLLWSQSLHEFTGEALWYTSCSSNEKDRQNFHIRDWFGPSKHNQAKRHLWKLEDWRQRLVNIASLHIFQRLTGLSQPQRRLE